MMPKPQPVMPTTQSMGAGMVVEQPGLGSFVVGSVKSFAVSTAATAAVMVGIQLARAWLSYEKNVGPSEEERRLNRLFGNKVTPGVNAALALRAKQAEEMTNNAPEFPVWANVTVELTESWTESGIAGNPSDKSITDARFIGLDVSFKKVSGEETIDEYGSSTKFAIKRLTYSVEIDFGETETERSWRVALHQARQVARRGLSARSVGEGTHWVGKELKSWEKWEDEQRRKWGDPTLAEQRAYDERERWVLAYIEYTAFHGPDDQYIAAVRYLEEIRRQPRPVVRKPLVIK